MAWSFIAVSAVVPSLLLLWYFHSRDLHPEPGKVLWTTFVLGILTVLPVLAVGLPVSAALEGLDNPFLIGLSHAFLVAAIPEEFFKLMVLLLFVYRHKHFDEPMDGIVYGVAASLGFATLENVMYVSDGGLTVAALRAVTAVPGHAFLGAILGYFVGQAKFGPRPGKHHILTGFLIAVLFHGVYDFPLLTLKELDADASPGLLAFALVAVAALVVEWRLVIRWTRLLRKEQMEMAARPAEERPAWAAAMPAVATPLDATASPAPAMGAAATPSPEARPLAPGERPSTLVTWVLLISGGLVASVGGLFTLAIVLGILLDPPDDIVSIIVAGVIVGWIPLGLGVLMFSKGVRRQREARVALAATSA